MFVLFFFLNFMSNCRPRMHMYMEYCPPVHAFFPSVGYLCSHTLPLLYLHVSGLLDAACVSSVAFSTASGTGG